MTHTHIELIPLNTPVILGHEEQIENQKAFKVTSVSGDQPILTEGDK